MKDLQLSFEAIGTKWVIDCVGVQGPSERISQKVHTLINAFDAQYSRFRPDSLITAISQKPGIYTVSEDAIVLMSLYQKLYDITDGAFTPLIGNVLEDAGYDASYSLKPKALRTPPKWEEVLEYNHPELRVKKPVMLDFGGLGKGYLIDRIGAVLEEEGVVDFCIDAGGDILYKNKQKKALDVGLEHPEDPKKIIGIASITNQSICASAGNRRQWDTFHHIINPHTLSSPSSILATWVVAGTALVADAVATSLFLSEPELLQAHFQFEYVIVYADYSFASSPDFPVEFY